VRIALFSDIHGNYVAFRAVLDDIRKVGPDQLAFLGDAATLGPQPLEVIRDLRELNCLCIMGNHDEFLINPESIHAYTARPQIIAAVDWCRNRIGDEELQFLSTFQSTATLPLGDGKSLFLYHGSPTSNIENIPVTAPAEEFENHFGSLDYQVFAGGHTHIQMARQHCGKWVINVGSVGMPFKEFNPGMKPTLLPHAEWCLLEWKDGTLSVDLRRVSVDAEAAIASANVSDYPLREGMLEQYQNPSK